jgi:hypothetical protein
MNNDVGRYLGMLGMLKNPIIQESTVNLLTPAIQGAVKEIGQGSIGKQFKDVIGVVIDRLSERYPIANRLDGVALWAIVAEKITVEVKPQRIASDHIKEVVANTLADLLKDVEKDHLIDQINVEF